MAAIDYSRGLQPIAPSNWAYLTPPGTWGYSNCGLVTSGSEALLVDTQFTKPLTQRLLAEIASVVGHARVETVVITHGNGDHHWGAELLPEAVIISSRAMMAALADETPPDQLAALIKNSAPGSALGRYLRRYFGEFDFSGITVIPPGRTFDGELDLRVGTTEVRLLEVGPAHTRGDIVVHVPGTGVMYTGDVLFIGDHPIMWSGPIETWVAACTKILDTGATVFVPGHGPVTDRAGVAGFRDYLEYVGEQARPRYQAGMPYWEAAMDIPMREPFASWGHRERLVITVAAIYRGLGLANPPDAVTVLGRTAEAAQGDLSQS